MATATAKPKIGHKRVMDMTKAEVETYFAEAATQAQKEIHAKRLPYTIGDKTGIYNVYPDGKKIFIPYGEE
jgi:hypothetical protein